jgi:hypothetical protein
VEFFFPRDLFIIVSLNTSLARDGTRLLLIGCLSLSLLLMLPLGVHDLLLLCFIYLGAVVQMVMLTTVDAR